MLTIAKCWQSERCHSQHFTLISRQNMYFCLYIWTLYLYLYTIRHVNMQHIHEIFTQLIFLTRGHDIFENPGLMTEVIKLIVSSCMNHTVWFWEIPFFIWQTLIMDDFYRLLSNIWPLIKGNLQFNRVSEVFHSQSNEQNSF